MSDNNVSTGDSSHGLTRPYTESSFQEKINDFTAMLHELTLQDAEASPEERRQLIAENLGFDQLCTAIRSLFGNDIRSQDIKPIFRKLTTNPDSVIDWTEIFGYLQSEIKEKDVSASENKAMIDDNSIFTTSMKVTMGEAAGDKRGRDTIQSMKLIPSIDSVIAVSQKGIITIWNDKLSLHHSRDIHEQSWATSVDYLGVLRRVVACTERSIHIFDHRVTGKQQHMINIKPFAHAPLSVCWVPYSQSSIEDTFVFGDNEGYINFVRITSKDLTPKHFKDPKKGTVLNFTVDPADLANPIIRRRYHDEWVTHLRYFPDLKCLGSCSPSQQFAFSLEPVERIWDAGDIRPITVFKGVNSFDYCIRGNVVVTGGVDKVIRVWHPHIWTRPTGKLVGHLFTICQVAVNEKDQHIISLSTARIFRVWDLQNLICLQIFSDSDDRPGERRIFSIAFDSLHERLITGSSVVEAWPLTRSVQDTMLTPLSHDRQLVMIISNPPHNHLISVCSEPIIKMWEVETGRVITSISEPHGTGVEITVICLEAKGFRLASGAIDGSIKVWDLGSGQDIKLKPGGSPDVDQSLRGLKYAVFNGLRCIIAADFKSKITIYHDTDSGHELIPLFQLTDSFPSPFASMEPSRLSPYPILPEIVIDSDNTQAKKQQKLVQSKDSEVVATFQSALHEDVIECVNFNQESGIFVSGTEGGNVLVWDLENKCGSKLLDLRLQNDPYYSKVDDVNTVYTVTSIMVLVHKSDIDMTVKPTNEEEESKSNTLIQKRGSRRGVGSFQSTKRMSHKTNPSPQPPQISEQDESPDQLQTDRSNKENNENTKEDKNVKDEVKFQLAFETQQDDDQEKVTKPAVWTTYPAVIVSGHSDGRLRFWSLETGALMTTLQPDFRPPDLAITAIAADTNHELLVVANTRGYICLMDVGVFLRSPTTVDRPLQLVIWRAHRTSIVSLDYLPQTQSFASASHDASIRLYWGKAGRYYGYFGQARNFSIPKRELSPGSRPQLPPDVKEKPTVADQRTISARQKERATRNMDYPLKFTETKWDPFSRTLFFKEKEIVPKVTKKVTEDFLERKFFKAVTKPKAYNDHLESSISGDTSNGAVFRSLPVYRIGTPNYIKAPEGLLIADLNKVNDMKKGSPRKQKKISTMNGRNSSLGFPTSTAPSRRSSVFTNPAKTHR